VCLQYTTETLPHSTTVEPRTGIVFVSLDNAISSTEFRPMTVGYTDRIVQNMDSEEVLTFVTLV